MNSCQNMKQSKYRALALVDKTTSTALNDRIAALEQAGNIIKVVDYPNLLGEFESIRRALNDNQLNFLLFSRNDQVFDKIDIGPLIRALRVGYSSFSGIDSDGVLEQTAACLDDLISGKNKLDQTHQNDSPALLNNATGTFSLIFDLEQLGGARFGLPRILDLLDTYKVRATFFITNFILEIYPNVLEILLNRGHEIGLHGQCHEYLQGLTLDQQITKIRQMKCDFAKGELIKGANFIYRMDSETIKAMIANNLDYFVVFMEHKYEPFSYRKMPLRPLLIWTPDGNIWMVPISVETYNRPWFFVKAMIDSALIACQTEDWLHLNILLHPFRDGSLRHIGDLKRLLDYLNTALGYRPSTITDVVNQLPHFEPLNFIYYTLDQAAKKPTKRHYWKSWWHNPYRYQQRICNLYQALFYSGHRPALCLSLPGRGNLFAVYPQLPVGKTRENVIAYDPLLFAKNDYIGSLDFAACVGSVQALNIYVPSGPGKDFANTMRTSLPRYCQDITGLLPEVGLRLAYRLSRGRHIF